MEYLQTMIERADKSKPQTLNTTKRTVVLGASDNPSRYSYRAVELLIDKGIEPVPVGVREGTIGGVAILNGRPAVDNVHTITLYLNPERQKAYYDYILGLKPGRIIFNPGTENPELMQLARAQNIEVEIGCTLVMLAVGSY